VTVTKQNRRALLLMRFVRRLTRERDKTWSTFYRTVSPSELDDIEAHGGRRLRPGPFGVEGKYLWRSWANAVAFGYAVTSLGWHGFTAEFFVVEVIFGRSGTRKFGQHVDKIGPAYFADPDQLQYVVSVRRRGRFE